LLATTQQNDQPDGVGMAWGRASRYIRRASHVQLGGRPPV
jgi:hypothetical protein